MSDKEHFYVELNDPTGIRKEALNTTRVLIESLKAYEDLKLVREEKLHLNTELKKSLDEISTLFKKLKTQLPKTDIPLRKTPSTTPQHMHDTPPKTPRVVTKLDQLEEQLNAIENKLKAL